MIFSVGTFLPLTCLNLLHQLFREGEGVGVESFNNTIYSFRFDYPEENCCNLFSCQLPCTEGGVAGAVLTFAHFVVSTRLTESTMRPLYWFMAVMLTSLKVANLVLTQTTLHFRRIWVTHCGKRTVLFVFSCEHE